jgi:hypothetical protein
MSEFTEKKSKSLIAGKGCLIQGLGLALLAVGIQFGLIGALLGSAACGVLMNIGANKAKQWSCGNCDLLLVDKSATSCPVCKSVFK